jgi:hypothetical protein
LNLKQSSHEQIAAMLTNKYPERHTAHARHHATERSRTSLVIAAGIAAAAVALAAFWLQPHHGPAVPASAAGSGDLAQLFKAGAGATLSSGDFLDLRDPACTRSFALRLAQRVFIRTSRNCSYAIAVESGRARANFLDPAKNAVELAPGRGWSAADFWSLTPLTGEVLVQLHPNS